MKGFIEECREKPVINSPLPKEVAEKIIEKERGEEELKEGITKKQLKYKGDYEIVEFDKDYSGSNDNYSIIKLVKRGKYWEDVVIRKGDQMLITHNSFYLTRVGKIANIGAYELVMSVPNFYIEETHIVHESIVNWLRILTNEKLKGLAEKLTMPKEESEELIRGDETKGGIRLARCRAKVSILVEDGNYAVTKSKEIIKVPLGVQVYSNKGTMYVSGVGEVYIFFGRNKDDYYVGVNRVLIKEPQKVDKDILDYIQELENKGENNKELRTEKKKVWLDNITNKIKRAELVNGMAIEKERLEFMDRAALSFIQSLKFSTNTDYRYNQISSFAYLVAKEMLKKRDEIREELAAAKDEKNIIEQ